MTSKRLNSQSFQIGQYNGVSNLQQETMGDLRCNTAILTSNTPTQKTTRSMFSAYFRKYFSKCEFDELNGYAHKQATNSVSPQ
jgi:hypothetical protein